MVKLIVRKLKILLVLPLVAVMCVMILTACGGGDGGGPPAKYNIQVNQTGQGTIIGIEQYAAGETVTLTAVPSSGHTFNYWFLNFYSFLGGERESTNTTITFIMPSHNVFLAAHFRENRRTLTVSTTSGGWVSGSILVPTGSSSWSSTFTVGSTISLNAWASSGYRFDGWYNGALRVSILSTYSFPMPNNDVSLQARFVPR